MPRFPQLFLFVLFVISLSSCLVSTFSCGAPLSSCPISTISKSHRRWLAKISILHASASKARATRNSVGNRSRSTSGFGGAAVEICPCGSGLGYMKCCGKIHSDPNAFASASAEQVVRARYSAYAKRKIDFIIGSTHPLNKDFMTDIQHWKKQISNNCYDNFELTNCSILDEKYEGEGETQIATVQFVANMTQVDSREKTAFMETSTFLRGGKHICNGAWLYRSGIIETPSSLMELESN